MVEKKELIAELREELSRLSSRLEEEKERLSVSFFSGVYDQLDEIKCRLAALEEVLIEDSTEKLRTQSVAIQEEMLEKALPETAVLEYPELVEPAKIEELETARESDEVQPVANSEPLYEESEGAMAVSFAEVEKQSDDLELTTIGREIVVQPVTMNDVYQKRRLSALSGAFSMNDCYRYQDALFEGSRDRMKELLVVFESFTTMNEANTYINTHLNWERSGEAAKDFMDVLKIYYS